MRDDQPTDGTEHDASTAKEFWDLISPLRNLFDFHARPIYRGQGDAEWKLTPSILRSNDHHIYSFPMTRVQSEDSITRIFAEIESLRVFAQYCDTAGLRIPGDSIEFRDKHLDPRRVIDAIVFQQPLWPSDQYFEIIALAQHHGLPTRLLDWSRSSYVAAYFAAIQALRRTGNSRLAVWVLNTEHIPHLLPNIRIIRVPGSNNANVAAQGGLFTLLRQEYKRGMPFMGPACLSEYLQACGRYDLVKITVPNSEAPKIVDLCERHGVTAAVLFPDFRGAAQATLDYFACLARSQWADGRDIRVDPPLQAPAKSVE